MKDSKYQAVAFTIALCSACSAVLTLAHTQWRDRIAANERFARVLASVDAVGLLTGEMDRQAVESTYATALEPARSGAMDYHVARREGKVIGYVLDVAGRGRYGPIRAVLAIEPDRRTLKNLRIYEQNETPGLGGRITSRDWLGQFAGKPMGLGGLLFSRKATGPNVIRPITGASKTMFSVSRMVNRAIAQFLAGGAEMVELRVVLSHDEVSKATPGYPSSRPRPPHLRQEVRRPPFMVPKGATVNLALGRRVTSSTAEPARGELDYVTDGVKKSAEEHWVELDNDPQWVQIDLGAERTIYAVAVWHYYAGTVIYNDVIVQVSSDAAFGAGVVTLFNNDHDNSSRLGRGRDTAYIARWWAEIVDARGPHNRGTRCRYVRVGTNGHIDGDETRFVEVAVYGRQ